MILFLALVSKIFFSDRIYNAMEDIKDGAFTKDETGFYLITLDTTGGTMQVLFQEETQYAVWKSTISHLSNWS